MIESAFEDGAASSDNFSPAVKIVRTLTLAWRNPLISVPDEGQNRAKEARWCTEAKSCAEETNTSLSKTKSSRSQKA